MDFAKHEAERVGFGALSRAQPWRTMPTVRNPSRSPRWTRALACAAAALLCACASPPPALDLAFVTLEPDVVNPKILRQEVRGEWCFTQDIITLSLRPPWQVRLADMGWAVSRAIDSVPGANVLTNVVARTRIEQYLLVQRVCSIVIGDAGRVE
jgi:hypothetical protein